MYECVTCYFFNNLTNYLYFYNKKFCLILNASMLLHRLHASLYIYKYIYIYI